MKGKIAVIGAGMAGMTCAQQLRSMGHRVEVFEREAVLGGRMATQRLDRLSYDPGAPYVTARTSVFKRHLDGLALAGSVTKWAPRLHEGQQGEVQETTPQNWYVGLPGMNSITRAMSEDIRVHLNSRVTRLERIDERWTLHLADGQHPGPFHAVLVTAPAPEAYTLINQHSRSFDEITKVRMSPCWTVLVRFEERLPLEFDAASQISEVLAWIARDSSKPSRRRNNELWILQAGPEWSREFLEEDPDLIAQDLWEEMRKKFELDVPKPIDISSYCWRYALVERSLASSAVLAREIMLGAAGDWCLGPRAEAAYESATALAKRVDDAFSVM